MEFPNGERDDDDTKSEHEHELQEMEQIHHCHARESIDDLLAAKPTGMSSPVGAASASQPKPEPAGTPSPIGSTSPNQPELIRYKKTVGAADGTGENYEQKMLMLLFLRMLDIGHEFQLASNMEEAGVFDDIVLRYRKQPNDPWRVVYLQLKHKQKKNISKRALLGISGDFSLVKYSASYVSVKSLFGKELQSIKHEQFIIFTTACVSDRLVDIVESDNLFSTGGKAVSCKAGGEVYRELCDWVDFKETLTKLHGVVDGRSNEEVGSRIMEALQSVEYQNNTVETWKDELGKCPSLEKLEEFLKKLVPISDKNTYSSFLAELHVYTNQAHESELDAKITEELEKIWIRSDSPEIAVMYQMLKNSVNSWWRKDSFYLTQNSPMWLDIIKSQTDNLSKNTVEGLTKLCAEFVESSLKVLREKIEYFAGSGGILHLWVDTKTTASSLKVHQALAKFGAWDLNVIHVNTKALLEHESDVLSAWSTRWCRVLVVECDAEIEHEQAARIGAMILKVVGKKGNNKLLLLIAKESHKLTDKLYQNGSYRRFYDNVMWGELTEKTKEKILSKKVVVNDTNSQVTLLDLMGGDKWLVNKDGPAVISRLMVNMDFRFGKDLDVVGKFFVERRLKTADGFPFAVNSLSDVEEKVVLIVAEPGMGKSTLITHLAKSAKAEDPAAWIVHIKLNDCDFLDKLDVEHLNKNAIKNILEEIALSGDRSCLEKLLFRSLEHKLVVLVDGVDEVCPHYKEQVFTFLGYLKEVNFRKLWVASRPVFQTQLEHKLGVKALHIVGFSEKDQRMFFSKVWMEKIPSATPEKCNEANESFRAWLLNSLGKNNHILEVPLITAMIAETFLERMSAVNGETGEFRENERFDTMNLYHAFVRKKFDIYCNEKKRASNRNLSANLTDEETLLKLMDHNHCLAALRVLFSNKEIAGLHFEGKEKFDEDLTAFLEEVSDGREKIGIIDNVIDGIPHFVHHSYAEYFAALWLSKNFQKNRDFIERTIFEPSYEFLSEMFHRALAQNHPLHVAVLSQAVETITSILSGQPKPVDVNEQDAGGRTPLHLAVLFSNTDRHPNSTYILQYLLLDHDARVDVADDVLNWEPLLYAEWSEAWTALDYILQSRGADKKGRLNVFQTQKVLSKPSPELMLNAARVATVPVVRYLTVERGGNLQCRGPKGETMIHIAAEGGNIELLEFLPTKGLSLDIKDSAGNTALRYATPQALSYLLECGLDLESVNKQGLTVLQDVAQSGEYSRMPALLEVNASYTVSPLATFSKIQLNASLLCATFAGSLEAVQNLVAMGASVLHQDGKEHTAAWVAMQQKNFEVMNWLLLDGCKDGDTSLHGAGNKNECAIIAFLLSQNADVDAKGWREQSPLIAAARGGHSAAAQLLLEKGACLEYQNKDGWTSLNLASSLGHLHVVARLLRHGADVTAMNNKGQTSLHEAASNNKLDVVELLLESGANVDLRDGIGRTPLHTASSLGHEKVAALLLRRGADLNAKDNDGRTALDLATKLQRSRLVTLLRSAEKPSGVVSGQNLRRRGGKWIWCWGRNDKE